MRNSHIFVLPRISLIFFLIVISSYAQSTTPGQSQPAPIPAPGNIRLPSGFVHERRQGIDSAVGAFVRSDGFTINYDIGRMAGNYADQYFPEHFENLRKQTHLNANAIEREVQYLQNQVEWRRRQKVNGEDVMIVLLKDSKIIASFPNSNANFLATVDSSEKVADFLLIVLTYQSSPATTTR